MEELNSKENKKHKTGKSVDLSHQELIEKTNSIDFHDMAKTPNIDSLLLMSSPKQRENVSNLSDI